MVPSSSARPAGGPAVLGSPALSFSNNEGFRRLVESAIEARRIVILCGAGVTADAGLPTWPLLLSRIAKQRAGRRDKLAPLVPANEADLARAAGLLLRRKGRGRSSPDYAVVSSALYDDQPPLPSTYLAQGIVDLVAGRGARSVALATTNYDDLLEVAAQTSGFEAVPCSLADPETWWDAFAGPPNPTRPTYRLPIYHLHGYLGRDPELMLHPIVITEDQFYREGGHVQAELRRMIVKADLVLCVGLSVTDANLVGALASLPRPDAKAPPHASKVYVVSVADQVAESLSPTQAERYTAERASYLHDVFGVDVVPLNSHAQVGQLMIELELALSQPDEYLRPPPGQSLRYGHRLARGLATAYRSVGWPTDGSDPGGEALAGASDALSEVLDEIRPALCRLVLRSGHDCLLEMSDGPRSASDLRAHFDQEGLGLFLWMPTLFQPRADESPRAYTLQLVAASAYAHRSFWSFRRKPIAVNAYASESAAKAAFSGQPVIEPTTTSNEPRLWKANIAVPLRAVPVDGTGSTVALGAVVLASDRILPTPNELETNDLADDRFAAIAYLSPSQEAEYCRIILSGVTRLLTSASA
jgi:hypothetical protein